MRKVEKNILSFINSINAGKKYFSERDFLEKSKNGDFDFYLWQHLIFSKNGNNLMFSFRGYQTNTTKNRLNVLIGNYLKACFCVNNYQLYYCYNGVKTPVDNTKSYKINLDTKELSIINNY